MSMVRRALVLCGVLLCCTPGPVSSRDGAAESPAARRVDGPAESEDVGGGTADSRLAQLRTLERVLAMEVSAVDALSRVQHDRGRRRETVERGVLRSAEGMWMRLFSQLEEEGEDEFAEMRCAEALSLHRSAASDDERAHVCAFVDARCSPRTGFFNYLAVPFCWFSAFPWLGALVLLLALAVMFAWIIAMVDFLIPALATLSKLCYLRQSVAGVTFLAFGNGCSDIFSMTAATLTGVKGMELAVGEVLGNGMLIFCFIQGIIAIITPFTANASEYLRDCGFYFLSLLLVAVVLFDGHISSVEGGMFLGLYAIYVVVVLNYERVLQALGMHPLGLEPLNPKPAPVPPSSKVWWWGTADCLTAPSICPLLPRRVSSCLPALPYLHVPLPAHAPVPNLTLPAAAHRCTLAVTPHSADFSWNRCGSDASSGRA